jgi:thioredoxin reductase
VGVGDCRVFHGSNHRGPQAVGGAHGDALVESFILLAEGNARIVGPNSVEVTTRDGGQQQLRAKNILVATGAVPKKPPIQGSVRAGILRVAGTGTPVHGCQKMAAK